jgi:hypothetical protein
MDRCWTRPETADQVVPDLVVDRVSDVTRRRLVIDEVYLVTRVHSVEQTQIRVSDERVGLSGVLIGEREAAVTDGADRTRGVELDVLHVVGVSATRRSSGSRSRRPRRRRGIRSGTVTPAPGTARRPIADAGALG